MKDYGQEIAEFHFLYISWFMVTGTSLTATGKECFKIPERTTTNKLPRGTKKVALALSASAEIWSSESIMIPRFISFGDRPLTFSLQSRCSPS